MATKTISVDLEAYERLRRARLSPDESFSRVIKRAQWPEKRRTAGELHEALGSLSKVDLETLGRFEEAQATDAPPEDKWNRD